VDGFVVPERLAAEAERNGWADWLTTLPDLVAEAEERWSLTLGEPFRPGGVTAWVAPAGPDLVLKVGWPHPESSHEAAGLRVWDGDGAVRLVDANEAETVLLLERCRPGSLLSTRPEPEQDVVVAGLLMRLWREPPTGFPTLLEMCHVWADAAEARTTSLDPGLVREGLALFRSLPATAPRTVLLVTDLHAGNVLAAERESWLAIDPKPHVGDPIYDALQHLLNCERLFTDPAGLSDRMATLTGVDPNRLRLWLFARCVQEAAGWPALADVARRLAP
jgi:streptomycin 6-kinase